MRCYVHKIGTAGVHIWFPFGGPDHFSFSGGSRVEFLNDETTLADAACGSDLGRPARYRAPP